ncbi:unnamed protein product [Trifolium pratense]|uniref:Uncharacterized protein n=1 Tax=Trifolium pratense TaxID=57577 RepID=A0ACB0JW34_TRIPR|nr:unnamed protein product [Trifolium pratense]
MHESEQPFENEKSDQEVYDSYLSFLCIDFMSGCINFPSLYIFSFIDASMTME